MNRQVIVHDRESAPSLLKNEVTYEIRRRPEVAIPAALVLGFFLGLLLRRTPLARATSKPKPKKPAWSEVWTEVRRLLR